MSSGGRKETRSQQVRKEDIPLTSSTTTHNRFTFQQSSRQSALLARRASIKLDVASFAAETYLPEYYLRGTLEADTEEAIQAALRSLAAARDKAEAELKRAVYKNHVEFVHISKEIMDFEGVLSELARIQVSLRSAATALVASAGVANIISLDESVATHAHEPGQVGSEPKTVVGGLPMTNNATEQEAVRPTIDWEARRVKMASLTETIADFDKYLSPDRYLIFEGGGISEQASGMGLSAKSITLYLFNDAIAMASKKTRMVLAGSGRRLVLERFWPLSGLLITDVPDTKSLTNAFKVTRGGENVLLQAETATGKRLWLQQIIKTQKALEGSSGEGGSGRERNPLVSRTASPMPLPPLPPTSPTNTASETTISGIGPGSSASGKTHKRTKSKGAPGSDTTATATVGSGCAALSPESMEKLSLLTSQLDTLNAEVDRCNYEAASELADKVKFELDQMDGRVSLVHRLSERLCTLVSKLAAYLYHEITDLIISKEHMAKYIQLLVVLGFQDEAREKFLAARSDFIRERTKHLRYVGDVAKTVNDIGFATFNSIAATADWYVSSFKDNPMTAGFVFWTKLEINSFVSIIVKQVFTGSEAGGGDNFQLIGECIAIARRHCASLSSIGLDLVFYLDDQLMPHIDTALRKYQEQAELSLSQCSDDWSDARVEEAERTADIKGITTSCVYFQQNVVLAMLNDVEPLLRGEMSEILVARVASLFVNYGTHLLQASYVEDLSVSALINIMGNVAFLTEEFLPSLRTQIETRFARRFADLTKLQARLEAMLTTMGMIFADGRSKRMVPADLSCYAAQGAFSGAELSDWLVTMLPLYAKISRDIRADRRTKLMQALLTSVLRQLQGRLEGVRISRRGMEQLLLDVHFLMFVSTQFLMQTHSQEASETCAIGMRIFKQGNADQASMSLKDESWYDQQVRSLQSKYPLDFGQI